MTALRSSAPSLFPELIPDQPDVAASTFVPNMVLPIHRWFRYSAGFSAAWVNELISSELQNGRRRVLDPFAGAGTTVLEAEVCDVESIGIEAHPFVLRIARAKLLWRESPSDFRRYAHAILSGTTPGESQVYPSIIQRCFPPETLARLDGLKRAWLTRADGSALSELSWLALTSILRECSPVGTAPWQYVLPAKRKAKALDPLIAFRTKVEQMALDMASRQRRPSSTRALLYKDDARTCASVPSGWADLVITSPPYANNYDYADATRLEMSFYGEIQGWGDLQVAVRQYLVRSCTQHAAPLSQQVAEILEHEELSAIRKDLRKVTSELEEEREGHGGKKPYHAMVAAYFLDMARVWRALRRVSGSGVRVCFVVGDSAPYGVYVPVDRWLGELAIDAGFKAYSFEKTRDRNLKWKNRKHRVPLHEGRLWVEG